MHQITLTNILIVLRALPINIFRYIQSLHIPFQCDCRLFVYCLTDDKEKVKTQDKGHQIKIPSEPNVQPAPANDMNLFHRKMRKMKDEPEILQGVPSDSGTVNRDPLMDTFQTT